VKNNALHCSKSPLTNTGGQRMPGCTTASWRTGSAAPPQNAGLRTRRELLDPARRYDTRADRIGRRACCLMIGARPEWAFWVILAVLVFLSLLPMLKR
jgi:hypothetical protein